MPQILEHIWQMKAPQIVLWGLFLFQRHPPSGSLGGGVLVTVEVCLPSALVSPTLEIPDDLPSRGEGDAFPK